MQPGTRLVPLALLVPAAAPLAAQNPRFGELRRMLPRAEVASQVVLAADLDGDLDADLLFVGGGQDRLFANAGDGRFVDGTAGLPFDSSTATDAALGDVDGDGDLDLFRVMLGVQHELLLNDGAGGFAAAAFPGSSEPLTAWAGALGDVDGDADLDAVVAGGPFFGGLGGRTQLFLGDGAGGFAWASDQIPPDADDSRDLALVDVDADGDLDVLLANAQLDGGILGLERLYENQGDGTFVDASGTLPFEPDPTETLALADVDLDGVQDVFLGHGSTPGPSSLWLGAAGGGFVDASGGLPADALVVADATFADVDADLAPDLVLAAGDFLGGAGPRLWLGDGAGGFADASGGLPGGPESTVGAFGAADLDGDGDVDLAVGTGAQPRLWLGDGAGGFGDVTGDVASDGAPPVLLGDLDDDGFVDALLGNGAQGDDPNRLYLGGVGGVLTPAHDQLPAIDDATTSGALGDVDGDGDLDAYWGDQGQDRLHLNDGAAGFADATAQLPAWTTGTTDCALGDLDGDGDLDALRAEFPTTPLADGHNTVALNDGAGVFSLLPGAFPPLGEFSSALAVGDVDGDGDLDAFVGDGGAPFFPGQDRVWLNDGSGVFADAPGALPYTASGGRAPILADFDDDGALELFIGGVSFGPDRLLENDGAGAFSDASAGLPAGAAGTVDARAIDADGDGALDLALTRVAAPALYLGDGAGAFADASAGLPAEEGLTRVAAADLDGDLEVDLWLSDGSSHALLWNLGRALAWRATPRVGKALVADVYGPPGGPWLAMHALSTQTQPLPPHGILYLPADAMFFLGFGMLDAAGDGGLALAVPQAPALVGATVYAQAAVGPQALLTNAEVALFTDL